MNKTDLKNTVNAAATEARAIVADPVAGRSPYAAGIRSNLEHAAELIERHEAWLAANPAPAAE